jgi:hypothetical protein
MKYKKPLSGIITSVKKGDLRKIGCPPQVICSEKPSRIQAKIYQHPANNFPLGNGSGIGSCNRPARSFVNPHLFECGSKSSINLSPDWDSDPDPDPD